MLTAHGITTSGAVGIVAASEAAAAPAEAAAVKCFPTALAHTVPSMRMLLMLLVVALLSLRLSGQVWPRAKGWYSRHHCCHSLKVRFAMAVVDWQIPGMVVKLAVRSSVDATESVETCSSHCYRIEAALTQRRQGEWHSQDTALVVAVVLVVVVVAVVVDVAAGAVDADAVVAYCRAH